jgi:ketosteroid isomerase-like protein
VIDNDRVKAAVEVATSFLRLVEDRDLEAASQYLAQDAEIVFPGGRRFADLESQIESSRKRFREVTKTVDTLDVVMDDDGVIVYVMGQLAGMALSGDAFEDVRFIDRFVVTEGLIASHRVWNDLAEVRVIGFGPGRAVSSDGSDGS